MVLVFPVSLLFYEHMSSFPSTVKQTQLPGALS